MGEFFEMGGYAAFVWPAYGLTAFIMVLVLWLSVRNFKETQKTFERLSEESDERKSEQ